MGVDGAVVGLVAFVPSQVQQLGAGEHPSRLLRQGPEKPELGGSERQTMAAAAYLVAAGIDGEVIDLQALGSCCRRSRR